MKKISGIVLLAALGVAVIYWMIPGGGGKKDDPDTLTVWHWMTDREKAFQELARQYEQKTGIHVKFDLFAPSDVYKKKITASTQANILPDVFGILDTKKTFADFIKYGFVMDLTEAFKKDHAAWEQGLFPVATDSNRFKEGNVHGVKPGIYGVPLDVTNIQMLYNKKMLAKAGVHQPPATFHDFVEVNRTLKRLDIPGMVSGWGELWLMDCFASNYAFNIMGEDKVMATYRGEVPYTDPDWIKVFRVFRDLVDEKMLVDGVVAKPNKEAEQDFALERAAFAFNGSWSVNVYHEMNPDLDYGVMMPPAIITGYPLKIWGGAGSSFVVNDRSPRKDKAVAFLKWLTEEAQQEYLVRATSNLPSNRNALAKIPRTLEEFARGMNNATHPSVWAVNEQPLVAERFGKGLQAILLGKKTPEEVAREVQEVKEREMEKAAKKN